MQICKLVGNQDFETIDRRLKKSFPHLYPVILEQYALLYLRTNKPMIRKFALHMAEAGNKYASQGYRKYAIQCYILVASLYEKVLFQNSEWYFFHHLIQYYLEEKQIDHALHWQVKLLNMLNDKQSQELQQKLSNECTYSFSIHNCKSQINLPLIDESMIDISHISENYQILNNIYIGGKLPYTTGHEDSKDFWYSLGEKHFNLNQDQKNILEVFDCHTLQAKNSIIKGGKVISKNEPIYIVFKAKNPLKIPIQMTHLNIITDSQLIRLEENIKLQPKFEQIVQLKFKFPQEGKFAILGLNYTTFGIQTDLLFKFYGNKQQKAFMVNSNRYRFSSEFSCLKNVLHVESEIPQLSVSFPSYDPSIIMGTIRPVKIDLKNVGIGTIQKVEICFMEEELVAQDYIKIEKNIEEGQSIVESFLVHVTHSDQKNLHMLIRYSSESHFERFHRCILPLQVQKGFDFQFLTESCLLKNWVYLNMKNLLPRRQSESLLDQDVNSIKLENIILGSDHWSFQECRSINEFYLVEKKGQTVFHDDQPIPDHAQPFLKSQLVPSKSQNTFSIGILWSYINESNEKIEGLCTKSSIQMNRAASLPIKLNLIYKPTIFMNESGLVELDLSLVCQKLSTWNKQKYTKIAIRAETNQNQKFFIEGISEKILNLNAQDTETLEFKAFFYEEGFHDLNIFDVQIDGISHHLEEQFYIQVKPLLL